MSQQQNNSSTMADSQAFLFAIMIAILSFFFWLIWTNTPKLGEMTLNFAYYLQYPFYWITYKLGFGFEYFQQNAKIIYELKTGTEPPKIGQVFSLGNRVGVVYLPFLLPIFAFYYYKVNRYPLYKFNRVHTAKTLMSELNKMFPYTSPIIKKDFLGADSKDPKWQPSVPPHVFALGYNDLKKKILVPSDTLGKYYFDEFACREVYENELGDYFDFDTVKPYEKALMAIFLARIAKDKKSAQNTLDDLAKSCLYTKDSLPNYEIAFPVFEKYKHLLEPFMAVHKYTRTMLMSMLLTSKLQGKLASSYFIWLKPVDRTLWYALNRVGAPTPFTQGAGLFCQWASEQIAWTGKRMIDWTEFVGMLSDPSFEGFQLDFVPEPVERYKKGMKPVYELDHPYVEKAIEGLLEDLIVSDLIFEFSPDLLYIKTQDQNGEVEMKKVDLDGLRAKLAQKLRTYRTESKKIAESNEKELMGNNDFQDTIKSKEEFSELLYN